jgi:hypothetical protein
MFKKVLSVIFVLLMLLSVVPFALAKEANYNYTVKTEFYGYDSETDDWVPVTTAAGGDTVKLRVSIATNYVSGSANFLLAYDKSVLSADLPSDGSADYLETNSDRKSFAYQSVQQVRGAHGTGVANKLFGNNCISEEEYNKYSFTTISIITKGCVMYDDTDWLFEIDMNVLGGTKGKTFECTVLPGSVQSLSNPKGYISFPKAPDGSRKIPHIPSRDNALRSFRFPKPLPLLAKRSPYIGTPYNRRYQAHRRLLRVSTARDNDSCTAYQISQFRRR